MMNRLVVLDIETTGLNPDVHEVWEIAWSLDFGPIQSMIVPHALYRAESKALEVNGYNERGIGNHLVPVDWVSREEDLRRDLYDATILGANPAFDTAFLRRRWKGYDGWHHRLFDIESYAAGVLNRNRPMGFRELHAELIRRGFADLPQPDHTAVGDVEATMAAYDALRVLAASQ